MKARLMKVRPMKAIRVFLALMLAAAATAVLVRVAIPRLECNLAKGRINRDVRRFARSGDEYERVTSARKNVARCRQCLASFPQDHHWHMLLGANLRILGDREEAIRSYQRALALTERPEIYAEIAGLEIERGNIEAARAALMKAATVHTLYLESVSDPLRSEVLAAVLARYERLQAKARK